MARKCKVCLGEFTPKHNSTERFCSFKCATCAKSKSIPKRINKVSRKRSKLNKIYSEMREDFLNLEENKTCFIEGCGKLSTTIEHRAGRVGYADDWARKNNISLFIDTRFWAGCCLAHNLELERNPELSKKYQLSKLHGGFK